MVGKNPSSAICCRYKSAVWEKVEEKRCTQISSSKLRSYAIYPYPIFSLDLAWRNNSKHVLMAESYAASIAAFSALSQMRSRKSYSREKDAARHFWLKKMSGPGFEPTTTSIKADISRASLKRILAQPTQWFAIKLPLHYNSKMTITYNNEQLWKINLKRPLLGQLLSE